MREHQPVSLEQLAGRLVKTDLALEKVEEMVATPTKIANRNIRSVLEESRTLPVEARMEKLFQIGERRKQVVTALEYKTLPGLRILKEKIEEEVNQHPDSRLREFLKGNLISEDELKGVERDKRGREIPSVTPDAIKAMNLFLENPNLSVEELINALGPSPKTGELRKPSQVSWSLGTIVLLIMRRKREGIATDAELNLWERIKNTTEQETDRDVWKKFRPSIKSWYRKQRPKKEVSVKRNVGKEKKQVPEIPRLHLSRIKALSLFIDKEDVSISKIIAVLGPSRSGKALNKAQAKRALIASAGKLFRRMAIGNKSKRENELWEKIKVSFPGKNDREIWRNFKGKIGQWYQTQANPSIKVPPETRPSRH